MTGSLDKKQIVKIGRRVLDIEESSLAALRERLGDEFAAAVEILVACKGRVVFAGMGKSGLVCRKIVATFASTGTPALFLHPAEGGHGDLGMLAKGDVLVAVSSSGESEELTRILPAVKRLGIPIVAMTGNPASTLAQRSDVVLDISVTEEACPLGLAPTASTAVTMALGDALAIVLLELHGFTENDFAFFHPGGALGRRLLTVADIMHTGDRIPVVAPGTVMKEALFEITSKQLGFTTVQDGDGKLLGVVTDGDLRRSLEKDDDPLGLNVSDVMTAQPKTINPEALAARALQVMESHSITGLVVVGEKGQVEGVIHLHDILRAGIA